MKRPLSFLCLAYVISMLTLSLLFQKEPPDVGLVEGEQCRLIGKVTHKEYKNNNLVVTVLVTQGSSSDHFSKEKNRIKEKNAWQVMCYLLEESSQPEPRLGSFLVVEGTVGLFRGKNNPGAFDRREYYHNIGIAYALFDTRILQKTESCDKYREQLWQWRLHWTLILKNVVPSKYAGIMQAMLLGEKADLDSDVKLLYQKSGISHVLAISGLHISLLGMGCYRFLRKRGMPISFAVVLGVILMVSYGMLSGMSVSTLRAIIMYSIRILADLVGRTYDAMTALSMAAFWVAWQNPACFFTAGVQFSFVTVGGLLILKPIFERFPKKRRWVHGGIMILLITFPLTCWHYYTYSVYSIMINFFVLPLMGILLMLGVMIILIAHISLPLAILIGKIVGLILGFYDWLAGLIGKIPGATWTVGRPKLWQVILYYVVLLLLYLLYRYISVDMIRIWLMVAFCLIAIHSYEKDSISFLSVGQGDGMVVIDKRGDCVTIDGGSSSEKNIGEYTIKPFLQYHGIDTIEVAVITHLDQDHDSGILEILEKPELGIRIKRIVLSVPMKTLAEQDKLKQLITLAESGGTEVMFMQKGDLFLLGDVKFSCVWPGTIKNEKQEDALEDDMNGASLVYEISSPYWCGLLTGDISSVEEEQIIVDLQGRQYDFLKVPHHGSKYSTCEAFLDQIHPTTAIISAGENNRYGHPHMETMDRLEKHKITIYQISKKGCISY